MNKLLVTYILFIFFGYSLYSQTDTQSWNGVIIYNGEPLEKADVIYMELNVNGGNCKGLCRIEINGMPEEFAVKSLKGNYNEGNYQLEDKAVLASSRSRWAPECKLKIKVAYNDSTGYLMGTFRSPYCRGKQGKLILFESDRNVTTDKVSQTTHIWKKQFVRNYKKGYPAPSILVQQKENFDFKPIYFDFDKAVIRAEFYDYLDKIARLLDAFTDLRVRITGNTDAYGTDGYNMSLSKERADAIREYFYKKGINSGKLEIDFNGERKPAATNETSEGRQENRRVNFEFI